MTDGYAVTGRQERFRGRVFSVLTDEVVMPDGHLAARDYVTHLGAVGVVAVDDQGRVVLIRQYRHALARTIWELPAGLLDVAHEPPHLAAARELAEEADLRAGRYDLLLDMHTSPGCSDEIIRLFLARDLHPVPEAERHTRSHEEAGLQVHRIDLDEAVAMAWRGEVTNAACLIGLLAAADARRKGWATLRPADTPLARSSAAAPGGLPAS